MEKIVEMMIKGDSIFIGEDVQAPAVEVIARGNLVAATTTAVGGVLKLQNTTGYDLYVKHMLVNIATGSTGAATLDIGVDDGGDVSNDTLIDGMNAQTAKAHSNLVGGGTNGGVAVWKKDEYVVATASATTAGMVGTYYIEAIPV